MLIFFPFSCLDKGRQNVQVGVVHCGYASKHRSSYIICQARPGWLFSLQKLREGAMVEPCTLDHCTSCSAIRARAKAATPMQLFKRSASPILVSLLSSTTHIFNPPIINPSIVNPHLQPTSYIRLAAFLLSSKSPASSRTFSGSLRITTPHNCPGPTVSRLLQISTYQRRISADYIRKSPQTSLLHNHQHQVGHSPHGFTRTIRQRSGRIRPPCARQHRPTSAATILLRTRRLKRTTQSRRTALETDAQTNLQNCHPRAGH